MKGHFTELTLSTLLVIAFGYIAYAGHVHNDQLAAWAQNVALQILAALLLAMQGQKSKPTPPDTSAPEPLPTDETKPNA